MHLPEKSCITGGMNNSDVICWDVHINPLPGLRSAEPAACNLIRLPCVVTLPRRGGGVTIGDRWRRLPPVVWLVCLMPGQTPLCSQVSGQRAADCSRKPQVNHARLWWVSLTHTLSVSAVSASSASERLRVSTVGPGGAEQVHGQP